MWIGFWKYDPDQPRASNGEFGSGGSQSAPAKLADKVGKALGKLSMMKHVKIKAQKDGTFWVLASSALSKYGHPVTLPGASGSAGVAVHISPGAKTLGFSEINNGTNAKGLGGKMVDAIMKVMPSDYTARVSVDLSEGFWTHVMPKYPGRFDN